MMGKDIEAILGGINAVKEAASASIASLASATAYRITSDAQHGGLSTGQCTPLENPVPSGASGYISSIRGAMSGISSYVGNMASLGSGNYASTNTFNNGYGSPWTEMDVLESSIAAAEAFAGAHASLNWVGEKAGLLGLLNAVLSAAIDAKWALITYHDYVQRGFDNVYNDNNPSVRFQHGLDVEGIGNRQQPFDENVHVKPKSLDPF